MSAISAITAGGSVVGQKTVGVTGDGRELVETTVEKRVAKSAAFGPAVQVSGSERFAGMAYQAGADDDPMKVSGGEKTVLDELRLRDGQVRQEEQAHARAAGDMGGAIQYTYARGPDGKAYVTGGYVPIRPIAASDSVTADAVAARLNATAQVATTPSRADLAVASRGYQLAANAVSQTAPRVDSSI